MKSNKNNLKNKKCFFCKSMNALVTHHIDTDRQNNKDFNLLRLCDGCHRKLHEIYRKLLSSGATMRTIDMNIVNVKKMYKLYENGISIHRMSIFWNLPYASLYRAMKKVEAERNEMNENGQRS